MFFLLPTALHQTTAIQESLNYKQKQKKIGLYLVILIFAPFKVVANNKTVIIVTHIKLT